LENNLNLFQNQTKRSKIN